ncbi:MULTISPECIES: nucleotide exchange factor GrpE [Streptomyces]|uniref:nucleotide exchange factor GrpE n=1 Tax=Streptomyces TaxID=1883 RepID=UPI0004CC451F|nr:MULTISPECIES: nucleotide exchange factor GrpE [Streptomyces]
MSVREPDAGACARALRRQEDAHRARTERLMYGLIDVLDSFDRLLAAPAAGQEPDGGPGPGVGAIARQLERAVREEGLEPLGRVGEAADPLTHHVVDVRPVRGARGGTGSGAGAGARPPDADGEPPGSAERAGPGAETVVEVVRRGYRFHGRLLRPASVVIAVDGGTEPGAREP